MIKPATGSIGNSGSIRLLKPSSIQCFSTFQQHIGPCLARMYDPSRRLLMRSSCRTVRVGNVLYLTLCPRCVSLTLFIGVCFYMSTRITFDSYESVNRDCTFFIFVMHMTHGRECAHMQTWYSGTEKSILFQGALSVAVIGAASKQPQEKHKEKYTC